EDQDIRVVIVTGAGKYFSTGTDLSMWTAPERHAGEEGGIQDIFPSEDDETFGKGTAVASAIRIRNMPKPVIAAVNGTAAGLGFSVALACDIIIASDRARFSMAFVRRGVAPDTGASFNLPRVVGPQRACELTFTGDTIDAAEAERIGLASRVVPHDKLMTAARELAERIAKNPPLAVGLAKSQLYQGMMETDMLKHMKLEVETMGELMKTADFIEAASAFMEKREPVFKGE
ncbi:MAG: enoyl-CoA hydratase-related protein, partial [Dehalococcoidia bacterium]|nr:enoyl-CoA hydratase-related protein [Dehalococcoidia bacterium]